MYDYSAEMNGMVVFMVAHFLIDYDFEWLFLHIFEISI